MLCENYDFVVIDGEAGIEQINRRVMESITYLVLVSDGSKKGISVISAIEDVANKLMPDKKSGVIFYRARVSFDADRVEGIPAVPAVIGELIVYDLIGVRNVLKGEICDIDLMENTILIKDCMS